MSKFLERIKQNKEKSIIIGIGLVVFIVGLVVTIVNTGDTYATPTGLGCYTCTGSSSLDSNNYWGLQPESSTCTGSWVSTSADSEDACLGYKVVIRYSVNGGEIDPSIVTDNNGVTHKWQSVMMNGIYTIFDGNVDYYQTIRYGKSLGTDGLANYNNEKFINITRDGYYVTSGKEWICIDGCTDENKVFSQSESYNSSAFCSAYSSNCRVTLGVNWQANTYRVSLDNQNATTAGTTAIYGKYDSGIYITATYTDENKMTTSTNKITVPSKKGYIFKGYYTKKNGDGIQMISNNGYVTNEFKSTNHETTEGITLYAYWQANTYRVSLDNQNATTAGTTAIYGKYDSGIYITATYTDENKMTTSTNKITVPTKEKYIFKGYNTKSDGSGVLMISSEGFITNDFTSTYHKSTEGITLYAIWDFNSNNENNPTYSINYNLNGSNGNPPASQTTKADGSVTLHNIIPKRTGYTFLGWSKDSNSNNPEYKAGNDYKFTSSTTLHAIWRKNNVYIKYNINAPTATITPETRDGDNVYIWDVDSKGNILKGEQADIYIFKISYENTTGEDGLVNYNNENFIEIKRKGYSAVSDHEWICLEGCTGTFNQYVEYSYDKFCDLSDGDCNITLGVNWKPNTYTVTFDANEGSVSPTNQTVTYDSEYGTLPIPTRSGYTFDGWYTSKSGGSRITKDSSVSITKDQTLYAHWSTTGSGSSTTPTTYTVNIKYSTNAGEIDTTSGIWSKNDSNFILKKEDKSQDKSIYIQKYNYNTPIDSSGLMNPRDKNNMYITRTGFMPKTGAEWKCNNGDCEQGKTYEQDYVYNSNELCDASNGDCTVVLGVNWTRTRVNIKYNANGGIITPETASGSWKTVDDIIWRDGSEYKTSVIYEEEPTKTIRLLNANNKDNMYVIKEGYVPLKEAEWICTEGDCKGNIYKINNDYHHNDFCDAENENCTVVLEINWTEKTENPDTYKVTFNANGGNVSHSSKDVTYNDVYGELPKPTKAGYTFTGWYNQEEEGTKITETSKVTNNSNHTLYARWKINKIKIKYSSNASDATILSETTADDGTKFTWEIKNNLIYRNGTIYTTTIDYGKSLSDSGLINSTYRKHMYVTKDNFLPTPTKEWICLEGCTPINKIFDADVTYAANEFCDATNGDCEVTLGINWMDVRYDIILDNQNATQSGTNKLYGRYNEGVYLDNSYSKKMSDNANGINVPSKNGATFNGYYTSPNGAGKQMITKDGKITGNYTSTMYVETPGVTWYANWKSSAYIITYDANGGSGAPNNQSKPHNASVTLSTVVPIREGYTFLGWDNNRNASSATYSAGATYENNGDVTLYAIWQANEYTISYNANGGNNAPSTQTKTHDINITLSNSIPEREGYEFLGWGTSPSQTTPTYTRGATYTNNASVVLYAIWKDSSGNIAPPIEVTYNITYDANGGTNVPAPETGNSITISSTRPNKIGYTFIGWNTSRDGSGTSYAPGTVYVGEPTATLYAQWQANTYNISINLNGGSLSGNPYEGTYDNIITIQNPTKTVTIHGNANGTDAFIGNDTSSVQEFAGWTSSTIDNTSAYYDNTAWTDGNVKVTATNFKNLTTVNGATVGLVANWNPTYITLPEVIKLGYTCNWNTRADGSGDKYLSGGQYLPSSDSAATINLYAECINNSNSDDEIDNPPKTGDILIVLAWIIGISSLGYSVYYLRSIKKD